MSPDTFPHPTTPSTRRVIIPRSPRALEVAQWFGVDPTTSSRFRRYTRKRVSRPSRPRGCANRQNEATEPVMSAPLNLAALLPSPGQIALITGPSGGGKSSLLRHFRAIPCMPAVSWIDLPDLPGTGTGTGQGADPEARDHVVDCFDPNQPTPDALLHLARVGLAEVWSYLCKPHELSDGQRWRLRLALAIANLSRAPVESNGSLRPILVIDEFAAVLDRITAAVVARALRRAVDELARASSRESCGSSKSHAPLSSIAAIVATSHDDLIAALSPDTIIRCDFGRCSVERRDIRAQESQGV